MTRRTLTLLVAAVAAYKSVEHLALSTPTTWIVIGAPLLIGAAWTLIRDRAGMTVIALGALAANLTPAYRNHLVLRFWSAATLAVLRHEHLERFALRWTLSIMYGFAAAAKVWPDWLSGESLLARTWSAPLLPEPLLVSVAWGTVAIEAALAYGVWGRWRGWFWIAVGLHLSFIAFTQAQAWDLGRLGVFGLLSLGLWLRAAASDPRISRPTWSRTHAAPAP